MKSLTALLLISLLSLFLPIDVFASSDTTPHEMLSSWYGIACLFVFLLAYVFVILEEKLHLKKSKPVLLAAGLIWILIAISQIGTGYSHDVEQAVKHNLEEYAELFFFLLAAMTYINAIAERGVFDALRDFLIRRGYGFRQLFMITGLLAFFISPVADNLTTALILCTVVLAVGKSHAGFISLSCINIVVAANAGGAFSPFGDITTLMVWQKGVVEFKEFFSLFVPSMVTYLVPALIMLGFVPNEKPQTETETTGRIKPGGLQMVALFVLTIITAVCFHSILSLPPVIGMMLGLGYLKIYSYFLNKSINQAQFHQLGFETEIEENGDRFDVFDKIARSEWDTLFFFYGIILAVGGLGYLGYLSFASEFFYGQFGSTNANILIGFLSAVIDNIPVMFAVLTMNPDMPLDQWLLITLTAGVGGSMLSIGSAAGVALMGQARGHYTFFSHLKCTPVILLGYFAGIWVHLMINS